jgi:hypothetical protein
VCFGGVGVCCLMGKGRFLNHFFHSISWLVAFQGVLGIRVTIMLPHDPTGKNGCAYIQPDVVIGEYLQHAPTIVSPMCCHR